MERNRTKPLMKIQITSGLIVLVGLLSAGGVKTQAQESGGAEMLANGGIESKADGAEAIKDANLNGWSVLVEGGAQAEIHSDTALPAHEQGPHSLRLSIQNPGERVGVVNKGLGGFPVKAWNWYDLAFFARTETNKHFALTVSLESLDGKVLCARTTLPEVGGDWQRYTVALFAREACDQARLVVALVEPGSIWFDDVSLLPRQPAPRARNRPMFVHDPSTIVKCKDQFWFFCTGRGTPSFHSSDLVHWERGPAVFAKPPAWVSQAVPANRSGTDFWAPDVARIADRYFLYYSASSFGKNTSAIGLATNPTLDPADPDYKWTDEGVVIQSSPREDFNTIDPAVTLDAEGNLWLAFGSFWSGIRMIQLDPATGKRIAPDSPIYLLAHYDSIEAPYIYHHDTHYYLFVNWGMCCRGVNSTYNIRVGRSDRITGPYLDRDGVEMVHGGGTLVMGSEGNVIGPGHAGIVTEGGTNWLSCHYYDGTRRGAPTLGVYPLTWDPDGWPQVHRPKP